MSPRERADLQVPRSVCILRLSALGDVCQAIPLVKTLQGAWPGCRFTWVIGRAAAPLASLLPGVEFVVVEKKDGASAGVRLRRTLLSNGVAPFDLLLHLQLSIRSSLLSTFIPARVKIGFDVGRASEGQWLFTNRRIAPRSHGHVTDGFFDFAEALGIPERIEDWSLPMPESALRRAEHLVPAGTPTLLVNPCSSKPLRDWTASRYAAVARHVQRELGWQVLLCGGRSPREAAMAGDILSAYGSGELPRDLVGKDSLPELLALLTRCTGLLTPDSGPSHMATLVDTPVIGLFAATNPRRSGPYRSIPWCVDRYDDAARLCRKAAAADLPWGLKLERPGVMDLITVDDVIGRVEQLAKVVGQRRSPL
jgi:heptosyltransferase I